MDLHQRQTRAPHRRRRPRRPVAQKDASPNVVSTPQTQREEAMSSYMCVLRVSAVSPTTIGDIIFAIIMAFRNRRDGAQRNKTRRTLLCHSRHDWRPQQGGPGAQGSIAIRPRATPHCGSLRGQPRAHARRGDKEWRHRDRAVGFVDSTGLPLQVKLGMRNNHSRTATDRPI